MNLQVIGEHTVDLDLLTPGGHVLDAGCRDFTFARALAARGCRVIAVDADATIRPPGIAGVTFLCAAVDATPGARHLAMTPDPQARHLTSVMPRLGVETSPVEAVEIASIMPACSVSVWDVVKLDVEGAEYDILSRWPGPIARQISVEFHEHVMLRPSSVYDQIFAHLGKWYDVVQHEKTTRHCCAPNYWDTLVVLR